MSEYLVSVALACATTIATSPTVIDRLWPTSSVTSLPVNVDVRFTHDGITGTVATLGSTTQTACAARSNPTISSRPSRSKSNVVWPTQVAPGVRTASYMNGCMGAG